MMSTRVLRVLLASCTLVVGCSDDPSEEGGQGGTTSAGPATAGASSSESTSSSAAGGGGGGESTAGGGDTSSSGGGTTTTGTGGPGCGPGDAVEIAAASSPFRHGEAVTLTGCRFGTKPTARPVKLDDFDDQAALGIQLHEWDPSWQPYDTVSGAEITDATAHSGGQAVRVHVSNGESFHTNYFTYSPPSTETYVSYWWRTADITCPGGGCGTIVKMSRITASLAGGIYNGPGGTTLGGTFDIYGESGPYCAFDAGGECDEDFLGDCQVAYLDFPPMDTWFRVEMYKRLGTPGEADGAVFVRMFGVDAAENAAAVTRAAGQSFELDTVLLGMMDGSPANHSYDILIDDVYVDTTQARVEVCDARAWDARGHCELQPASAWDASGERIEVAAQQGSFSVGESAFVYVVSASGDVNAVGYPVTFE